MAEIDTALALDARSRVPNLKHDVAFGSPQKTPACEEPI
jgi:hypothetical protein